MVSRGGGTWCEREERCRIMILKKENYCQGEKTGKYPPILMRLVAHPHVEGKMSEGIVIFWFPLVAPSILPSPPPQ